jgi:hypothetical protein
MLLGPLAGDAVCEYWAPELAFAVNGVLLMVTATLVAVRFDASPAGVGGC